MGVTILAITKIPYEAYEAGGNIILFFLSPVIVMLAVPLYRNYRIISNNKMVYALGCVFAFLINFVSIFLIFKIF